MKQEYKELLLVDLCARLPYGVKVFYEYVDDLNGKTYGYSLTLNTWCIDQLVANKAVIKPYLRPISSMTEEEKGEYRKVCELDTKILENHPMNGEPFPALYNSQDWLNKKRIAYRTINDKDMFELGLAIPEPVGMYDNEQNK